MAAYAALLSLTQSLHQILNLDQCIDPLHKEKIVSLHAKVNFIVTFLEDYSDKYCETLDFVGDSFRKAAYEVQDFMDWYLCLFSRTNDAWSYSGANYDKITLDQDLNIAFERINFIWEEAMKIKNHDIAADLQPTTYSSPLDHSSTVKITAKNMFVECDDNLNAIKERLYEDSNKLEIIPIVGMGGIGKTTLARKAYEDSLLARYFDISAWITVSAEYQRSEVLSGILQSFKKPDSEQSDKSDAQLAKLVYQNLMGRRYLIVIDDIWSTHAWDDLKMIFPDDGSGSRILLTTRLSNVAVYAGSSSTPFHQMNFLNEDQSWKLFQETIFGQQPCPLHLVEIGRKIARNCGGLPLTIVVVAGLLLSTGGNMTKEELWENISRNISSTEPTIALQCSKILCLSYDRLPLRLKPCFLYISAFQQDSEIDVSKLVMLWVAEGFLKPEDQSKCLEDVGVGYLEDLVNRSLILVRKKGSNGKLKTVGIHDLLREICTTKAIEEGFLHHLPSKRNVREEIPNRRLCIHFMPMVWDWETLDLSVRSVLLGYKRRFSSNLSLRCNRLNVLDAPKVIWNNFSKVISTFIHLRYITFDLDHRTIPHALPVSISKLANLQTIVAHAYYTPVDGPWVVPYEILEMPKLRHLIIDTSFRLLYPSNIGIARESDLQTLITVIDFRFTKETINLLVNLKKLKVFLKMSDDNWEDFKLNNLYRLQNLEELEVHVFCLSNCSMIWNHTFPISLKKLVLIEVPFRWENMSMIGSLPNLQVLKMINIKVTGVSSWTPMEGQFLWLKYFCSSLDNLVQWEVEKEHFPNLESLILQRARWIDEIPYGIGEIDSLQLIELQDCSESLLNSAKRIQDQQHENGNDAFQVRVFKYTSI